MNAQIEQKINEILSRLSKGLLLDFEAEGELKALGVTDVTLLRAVRKQPKRGLDNVLFLR